MSSHWQVVRGGVVVDCFVWGAVGEVGVFVAEDAGLGDGDREGKGNLVDGGGHACLIEGGTDLSGAKVDERYWFEQWWVL